MSLFECYFVSDLHGKTDRYDKLFDRIGTAPPEAIFIGGDILPFSLKMNKISGGFIDTFLTPGLRHLRDELGANYPKIFIILGNDDPRSEEATIIEAANTGLFEYIHDNKTTLGNWNVYGYSYVPPTPFMLKDWERYDVSRYVDPGCYPPHRGKHTIKVSENELKYSTIKKDLDKLFDNDSLENAVILFHSPPYNTNLDTAALDGKFIDGVPLDPHIGSIAIERFIKERQPLLTLHGHVHESSQITGHWQDKLGATVMFNAAYHGKELSLVKFDLENPEHATREIL